MNKLSTERRIAVVKALAEGKSIRLTARLTGAAKATVTKLLVSTGTACADYQDKTLRNLPCQRVRFDELWAFVGATEKNMAKELRGQGRGDVWTWTAMDAGSKLLFSWLVCHREMSAAQAFMDDVADRIKLSTEGLHMCRAAVETASESIGAALMSVIGNAEENHIYKSLVERQNLTIRTQDRRLMNGLSKKIENHAHSVALHFFSYNFCRSHQTLTKAKTGVHTTPAMAAGLTDHVWKVEELIALLPD